MRSVIDISKIETTETADWNADVLGEGQAKPGQPAVPVDNEDDPPSGERTIN